jgi:hypothetical protein
LYYSFFMSEQLCRHQWIKSGLGVQPKPSQLGEPCASVSLLVTDKSETSPKTDADAIVCCQERRLFGYHGTLTPTGWGILFVSYSPTVRIRGNHPVSTSKMIVAREEGMAFIFSSRYNFIPHKNINTAFEPAKINML